ncbi:MAG: tRNA dihydrouridine synthase DusB [Emergencia sp.]|nr:tRNA dihydrouridine synthase DusB [Emergencia sp.]
MNKVLKIGNVILDNPFFLAPLAGITDAPTRRICREMGAALVYSEMVSGKGLYYKQEKTKNLLHIDPAEKPVAFQVFGSEPEILAFTARELDGYENAILDINMGCPVPKIVKNGEGSALLKRLDLVYDLISAMTANTKKPVTAKIRIGFDASSVNAVETAKAVEAGGAAAVAVHGRTREQYYSGKADWSQIAAVKQAVSIPVIGNGDVTDGQSAMAIMEQTGCDFVMIGRGALGNPWIFRQAVSAWRGEDASAPPTLEERKVVMKRHFRDMSALKGDYVAVREMRKHVGWYLKGQPGSAAFRGRVNQIDDAEALVQAIDEIGK